MNHFIGVLWQNEKSQEELNRHSSLMKQNGPFQVTFEKPIEYTTDFYENQLYIVVFHGEVYNTAKLKEMAEVEQAHLPELIAELFDTYHTDLFDYIQGKFTVIIWDKSAKMICCGRDGFGVKPLFYAKQNGNYIFSSKKKLMTEFLGSNTLSETALQHYLSYQYVPEPLTMTEGIQLIEPGTYLKKRYEQPVQTTKYWHPTFHPVLTEKRYWIEKVREVLYDTVEKHMGQDESIGSFLSGGIDSTIVASIAKQIKPDLKTFSVGFAREGFSEVDVAKETAEKLGVENISYIVSPEEYVEKLPEIIWQLDDPLADPACVPLYFVARVAKQHVDIALSGEGADELFGGYNIYREPTSLKIFDYVPQAGKNILRTLARQLPEHMRGKSFLERGTTPLKDRYIGNAKMFEEAEKSELLHHYNDSIAYQDVTRDLFNQVSDEPLVTQMQYIDMNTWLPGDILLKAEKMSGANQLNVRMPFLDMEVFSLASQIPVNLKIADGTTKAILREAARGMIPNHVLDRRKLGFPVPIRHWLKNELHAWALQLIEESETDAYLNKAFILELLDAHCKGQADNSRKIWTILMFMLWHQVFIEDKYVFE